MPKTYQPVLPNFVEAATYYEHDCDDAEAVAVARTVPEDEINDLGNQALKNALQRQLKQSRLEHNIISFPFVDKEGTVSHIVSVQRRWEIDAAELNEADHLPDEPFEMFVPHKSKVAKFIGKILR